jgi:hypothetical protein
MAPVITDRGEAVEPASRMEPAELAAIRALDDAYCLLAGLSDQPDRCWGTVVSHGDGYLECGHPDCPGPYTVLHDPDHVDPCVLRPDLVTAMAHRCPRCPAPEPVAAVAGPTDEIELLQVAGAGSASLTFPFIQMQPPG